MAGEVMEDEGHHHALDYLLDHMMTAVMTVEIEDIMLETAHAVVAAVGQGPVVARAPARHALDPVPAVAAALAPVLRHGLCRGQDLVLHPKTRKNLTKNITL